MTIQLAVSVRNAMLQAKETDIGPTPILKLRSGARPTNLIDASSGTVLATLNLPSDWMAAPSAGTSVKAGTWQDVSADASGTVGHYEITASDGTTVKERGTVTATGGGGDMTIDNTVISAGQTITVTAYGNTAGNP
jgi:hypothetical protein